jgi:hypothetical protein
LTYGIILGFIVALIILNNTFLRSYYINNRENSLVEAFGEIEDVSLDDADLHGKILEIESRYNLSVQILLQKQEIPADIQMMNLSIIPTYIKGCMEMSLRYRRKYFPRLSSTII